MEKLEERFGEKSHTLTREENAKGGRRSQEVQREKRLFKETIEKKLGKSIDSIIDAIILKSEYGDIQASTFLRDTIGEKPTDKIEAEVNSDVSINIELSDD